MYIYACVYVRLGSKHMALSEVVFSSLAHFSFTTIKGVVCVEAGGPEGDSLALTDLG